MALLLLLLEFQQVGTYYCLISRPNFLACMLRIPAKSLALKYVSLFIEICTASNINFLGLTRTIQADMSAVLNQIPVDMVTKSLVVSAWDTASRGINQKGINIDIVHCTSDGVEWMRPTYQKISETLVTKSYETPVSKVIWTPNLKSIRWTFLYEIYMFIYMVLPFYLFDKIRVMSGRKPRYR